MTDLDGRRGVKTVQRAVDAISRQEVADGQLVAAGTVHRIVAVLRSALSEARRKGLVSTNAAWRLRLPRGARPGGGGLDEGAGEAVAGYGCQTGGRGLGG